MINWDAVAGISEALGALGVIATVIYLAFQIRQNTRSIQGSTEQSLVNSEMTLFGLLAQHASVYRRGCASVADLDPDEESLFEHLVVAQISQLYGVFVQYQRKLIPEYVWITYLGEWTDHVKRPGFRRAWSRVQVAYPNAFRQCLDEFEKASGAATDD
jgi:hypothetical protein